MRRFLSLLATPGGRVVRYLISLGLLALLIHRIDRAQLSGLRGQFSLPLTVAAFFLAGVTYPLHAWRWHLLLRAQGLALSLHWAHVVTWIGQFYNAFLLGGVGGDAARIFYLLRDAATQRVGGFVTLVIDRGMGLGVLMAIAAVALAARTATLATDPRLHWLFIAALTITFASAAVTLLLLRLDPTRWPPALLRLLGPARVQSAAHLIGCVRAAPQAHAVALVVTAAIWILDFIAAWLLARAVGLPLPFLETCVAMSAAYASTALPINVGGHGVREGALLATLTAFGLLATPDAQERALLLALLVWATTVFWGLVGGLVVLSARRLLPPVPPVP
ncbi:MAG: flippase-like domain-containing protein [Undibacterium sp.]|nr:flippase-like domain-containing protein [Opitutaceae bacterium]